MIALGQVAGFTLDEIAHMVGANGSPNIDRELLVKKADDLDITIQNLVAMREGLRHAAVCSAPSHMECPKFRRLLGLAASGAIQSKGLDKLAKRRRSTKALHRASY